MAVYDSLINAKRTLELNHCFIHTFMYEFIYTPFLYLEKWSVWRIKYVSWTVMHLFPIQSIFLGSPGSDGGLHTLKTVFNLGFLYILLTNQFLHPVCLFDAANYFCYYTLVLLLLKSFLPAHEYYHF